MKILKGENGAKIDLYGTKDSIRVIWIETKHGQVRIGFENFQWKPIDIKTYFAEDVDYHD